MQNIYRLYYAFEVSNLNNFLDIDVESLKSNKEYENDYLEGQSDYFEISIKDNDVKGLDKYSDEEWHDHLITYLYKAPDGYYGVTIRYCMEDTTIYDSYYEMYGVSERDFM